MCQSDDFEFSTFKGVFCAKLSSVYFYKNSCFTFYKRLEKSTIMQSALISFISNCSPFLGVVHRIYLVARSSNLLAQAKQKLKLLFLVQIFTDLHYPSDLPRIFEICANLDYSNERDSRVSQDRQSSEIIIIQNTPPSHFMQHFYKQASNAGERTFK